MTKTWKIGEYCRGGIITVEITGKKIDLIGIDWDTNEEWIRLTVQSDDYLAYQKIDDFLYDMTTDYYAGNIMRYIKENCNLLISY